ncbi:MULTISPECIES: TIGR04149 family rSAM-modified RiPP [unclassified Flavobacterium]|nr:MULTISPECIES: TIGR04149 family rSAM-modified RiPP [unclassified Flavobacterium]
MENKKLNFEAFTSNTLSKKEQKAVRGGDNDTNRGNGKGSTQPVNI